MKFPRNHWWLGVISLLIVLVGLWSQPAEVLTVQPISSPSSELYPVTHVRDGDTIEVLYQGKTEAVRLVGVNTPESVDPRRPVQCFGQEASAYLKAMLQDKSVRLQPDPTQSDRDRYGRLLRFVFLDEQDVGLKLILEGYAQEAMYSDIPHVFASQYVQAELLAQTAKRGLWADDLCLPSARVDTVKPEVLSAQSASPEGDRSDWSCNCQKSCSQMSCAEAQFQLESCGCTDRDGDGDGKICENFCEGN